MVSPTSAGAGHYWWSVRTWYDNGGYELATTVRVVGAR